MHIVTLLTSSDLETQFSGKIHPSFHKFIKERGFNNFRKFDVEIRFHRSANISRRIAERCNYFTSASVEPKGKLKSGSY